MKNSAKEFKLRSRSRPWCGYRLSFVSLSFGKQGKETRLGCVRGGVSRCLNCVGTDNGLVSLVETFDLN